MIINQDVLNWLKSQPITNDRGIAFCKGLYKIPSSLSEVGRFMKFVKQFGHYYK